MPARPYSFLNNNGHGRLFCCNKLPVKARAGVRNTLVMLPVCIGASCPSLRRKELSGSCLLLQKRRLSHYNEFHRLFLFSNANV